MHFHGTGNDNENGSVAYIGNKLKIYINYLPCYWKI